MNNGSSFYVAVAVTAVFTVFTGLLRREPRKRLSFLSFDSCFMPSVNLLINPVRRLRMQGLHAYVSAFPEHEMQTKIILIFVE